MSGPTTTLVFQRRGVLLLESAFELPAAPPIAALERVIVDRTIDLPGAPAVRAVLVPDDLEAPAGHAFRSLRTALMGLPEPVGRGIGRALQLVEWERDHRFCGRCGGPTEDDPADRSRRCPTCELAFHPRVSPAVIVLVERGDEALLARSPHLPERMYSTLAGFVEPGEDLEETVVREVREEVGVELEDLRYFASQPWPFPHSLMVGFHARWAAGEIRIDPNEIEDAAWFRVDALPTIPPRISIARHLIDDWRRRCGAA